MENTTFVPVTEGLAKGGLVIIRGGNRIEGGNKTALGNGEVVIGRYEGAVANKYEPTKLDFKVRAEDGTLFILAQTANLARDFAKVNEGELVQVMYHGKRQITKGKLAGKSIQDFQVNRALNAE